jgi:hypothetical protein
VLAFWTGPKERLASSSPTGEAWAMTPETVVAREDIDAIFAVLFDIKAALLQIVHLLGGEDEEEEAEEDEP